MLLTEDTPEDPNAGKRKVNAVVIALLAHLALIALAVVVVVSTRPPYEPDIVADIIAPDREESPKMEKKTVMKQVKQTSSASAASPIARMLRANTVAQITAPDVTKVSDGPIGLGEGDFGDGFGSGSGAGGMGSGAMFFGMKTGQDMVIVIDISGSMVQGSNSRESYDKLEEEAVKAISAQNSTARFNIIAFAGKAYTFDDRLAVATAGNKGNAVEWLKSHSPCLVIPKGQAKGTPDLWNTSDGQRHRGTSSGQALRDAFEMKPRTIIFVSDGEPTDASGDQILSDVEAMQESQSPKVTIHAIAYRAGGGQRFMESLAKNNGGTYKDIR